MTKETKSDDTVKSNQLGLAGLREPFPSNAISKLPKPTKRQTKEVYDDFKKGIRCKECGGWHHKDVVHLDYVGHAALTDRLLDCDPLWNWEPVRVGEYGEPIFDNNGGMWIKLTVSGTTRLGYGDADGKQGGNAIKEAIGDALRNAAMRFGAALDLWHKGELHPEEPNVIGAINADQFIALRNKLEEWGGDQGKFLIAYKSPNVEQFPAEKFDPAMKAIAKKIEAAKATVGDDEITY